MVLFAHAHRKSSWHSVHSLASNVHHANWEQVAGFAYMHQNGMWDEVYVANASRNIEAKQRKVSDGECHEVSSS